MSSSGPLLPSRVRSQALAFSPDGSCQTIRPSQTGRIKHPCSPSEVEAAKRGTYLLVNLAFFYSSLGMTDIPPESQVSRCASVVHTVQKANVRCWLTGPGLVGWDVSSTCAASLFPASLLSQSLIYAHQQSHQQSHTSLNTVGELCRFKLVYLLLFALCVCVCAHACARVIKREKEQRMHKQVSGCGHLCNNQRGPPSFLFDFLLAVQSSARRRRREAPHRAHDRQMGRKIKKHQQRMCGYTPCSISGFENTHRDTRPEAQ